MQIRKWMLQEKELKLRFLVPLMTSTTFTTKRLGPVINLKKCSVDNDFQLFNVDMD